MDACPNYAVIVDTMPPRLEIKASRNAAGDILVGWLAVDPLLKADTLKIACRADGETIWHPVRFAPPGNDPSRDTATGTVSWRPIDFGKTVIRAEIADQAGNLAVTQATLAAGSSQVDGPALGRRRRARQPPRPSSDRPVFPPPMRPAMI